MWNVDRVEFLNEPPGNRQKLRGDRTGQWSIRINDQWRICFEWKMAMPTRSRLSTTIRSKGKMPPLHPGEMLREEFMRRWEFPLMPWRWLHVPVTRISEIVNERRSITADTALRLARYFGMPASFWMNLQTQFEVETAEDNSATSVRREVHPAPRNRKTGELKVSA